ncbi:uncharacterized protein LOC127592154 [Hippocampus zosterae]|uniref:uncharacterized protein LOC127592154 n=1 Tax=Hippocampus zosterae TaxID=109293 RepID=UPI00223D7E77|nr:uncharacterized protein LOC127592154 [Hippocampus zosterae]
MRTAALFLGMTFLTLLSRTHGRAEVEWACRDRYLWIQALSKQTARFEAIDADGAHPIDKALASRCGYTISTFEAGGYTTFRASYYSCFTLVQDDRVFTFRLNVMVSDGASGWTSHPVSATCSGPSWLHREIVCEEDYMEANVRREASCAAGPGPVGQAEREALSQAVMTASWLSQLMFLRADGRLTPVPIGEAEGGGYAVTLTANRAVLRASYKAAEARLIQVDGVDVVVLGVFLFYKRQLTVVTLDMSVACAVNAASYDGARLVWDLPNVLRPLLEEGAAFRSRKRSLEVDGATLDEQSAAAKGFGLLQQEELVQISVPFGAEGGYTRSLVADNVYKESFVISLLYEHLFSAASQDGGAVDTKVRIARVLQTPLLCRRPFSLDQTAGDAGVFAIYLGNIPSDVILEEVRVNGARVPMEPAEGGFGVTPVVHLNGSTAYQLRLPFTNAAVHRTYMGEGVVRHAIDVNFTLTHVPHRTSYYHHTSIAAQVFSAFPPKITAQCLDRGILFGVAVGPGARSLWEVGVEHQPLTPQLAAQRGYRLLNDSQKITLEVPVFSIGYTYEDINLSNFYGTFKLLLRDARTLEVQTSTSKQCLFKTEDMIVCSSDGIITVVTRPTSTWPAVRPEMTSLLDPTCRPKETDATRVLFQFRLDSCGTRATVGDYAVYENEILHDRRLIADGPNFISRDSQFKLTVRCFYPLSGINRLTADRISRSETPGFGSIDVFGSLTGPNNLSPDCLQQLSRDEMSPSESAQSRGMGQVAPVPAPSRSLSIPGHPSQTDVNSAKWQSVPQHTQTPPGPPTLPAQGRLEDPFPHEYQPSPYGHLRPAHETRHGKRVEATRNWSPVSQTELSKPNQPRWTSETVTQIPPGFGQSPEQLGVRDQPVNRVQSIRVKPQRLLPFQIPSRGGIHWPSPSLTGVSDAKDQTPRRPEGPEGFAPPGNWRRLAETPNAPGKMSSALDVLQMAGPSQSTTGPGLGGFTAPAQRRSSDEVSSLGGDVKTAPHPGHKDYLFTRDIDGKEATETQEGDVGSAASQMGSAVDWRSSDQRDCRGPPAARGASIHHGIIRAMEGLEHAARDGKRPSSGGHGTRRSNLS